MLKRDKKTARKILTTEGWIRYYRYRLYAVNTDDYPESVENCKKIYGTQSVYPLDMFLGIDKLNFKMTADMELRIAKIGATSSSYKEASNRISEDFEYSISDDTIRKCVNHIGSIVLQDEIEKVKKAAADYNINSVRSAKPGRKPKTGFDLYIQADGAMFNTRIEKNSKESSWKENKLAIAFKSSELKETNKKDTYGNPIYRIDKREYICTAEGVELFRDKLLWLAIKNGLYDASHLVIISDGAVWIRKTKERFFPYAVQILDLFHLKENVMSFGQYIFKNKKEKYYPWWIEICEQLENGNWKEILKRKEISEYKDKATPKGVVNLYQYIDNNKTAINYPEYRKNGFFVGSGAIESGNKTVLQQRLKLAGMRWDINVAEALLALRTKIKSNRWNDEVRPLVYEYYRNLSGFALL